MKRFFIVAAMLLISYASALSQTRYAHEVDSLIATAPAQNEYNRMKRDLFAILPVGPDDIIFFGDSITDRCEWDELFDNKNIKNRGISGEYVRWMLDRYEQLAAGHPRKLFFLGGINDLRSGKSEHEVEIMIAEFVTRFHKSSPETQIYVQSILPLNLTTKQNERFALSNLPQKIDNCNKWLREWCSDNGITYIDVASSLKNSENEMNIDYTFDGLHPNAMGYQIWKGIISGYVNE